MIETTIYKRLRFSGIGMLLCGALLISDGALAHNKVVVIPMAEKCLFILSKGQMGIWQGLNPNR